ncbi:MAG: hypothetical protein QOJ61_2469, partial [Mycobacterium sp.]|nr:hypothetical protein [Mycobacterium sp.]
VCFAVGEISRVCVTRLDGVASRAEMLVGELADGLQHPKPSLSLRSVGDEQGFAYQRVEKIENLVVVQIVKSAYSAGALEVESTNENRTPFQQRSFRVLEKVIGPRHRVAQRLVAPQSPA